MVRVIDYESLTSSVNGSNVLLLCFRKGVHWAAIFLKEHGFHIALSCRISIVMRVPVVSEKRYDVVNGFGTGHDANCHIGIQDKGREHN